MKKILGFTSYVSENYPAGSENDPNAPWNRSEPEIERASGGIKKNGRISLLGTDFSEFLLGKDDVNDDLYVGYFDSSDLREYAPYTREYVGKDEDGYPEYDYDYLDLDEESISSYLSDIPAKEIGIGLSDWESGKSLVKIDEELAKEIYNDFREFLKETRWRLSAGQRDFYQRAMSEILKRFPDSETLVDLAGIDLPK